MKFCYLDESGGKDTGVIVLGGIIVDSQRMNLAKRECSELLSTISTLARREVSEIHAKDLIPGRNAWNGVDSNIRLQAVTGILDWLKERKHKITFAAISVLQFNDSCETFEIAKTLKDSWTAAAFHNVLALQRAHQTYKANKGDTLLIFDKGRSPYALLRLLDDPPTWTDEYYGYKATDNRLSKIVDVPYYADSHRVVLIQIADLCCYILRRYAELNDLNSAERFAGELQQYTTWVKQIQKRLIATSNRYRKQQPCVAAKLFTDLAPSSLTKLQVLNSIE